MARAKTPSFITEVPLVVSSKEDADLLSRFQAGRQLYNALLNEAMVRVNLVSNSELFKHARKMAKGKARNDAFQLARTQQRYSEFELMSFATQTAKSARWISEKIDSATQQKLATRAFQASEKVLFGRAKKVRFKVPNRFNSMEGKSNKQGIRWSEDQLVWSKLRLDPIIDESNLLLTHGLTSPIKYVRILKRDLNGKRRWFAQLICEGLPYQKYANFINTGSVGIDLNDQTGIVMQRDLFSAYLARYVDDDELTLRNAQTEYLRQEPVLLAAWQRSKINCERVIFDESRLGHPPLEQFANDDKRHSQIGELCSDRKAV